MSRPLRIVRSCGESWDAMTPRNGGKHCARCDRVVLDLRGLTRAEALARVEHVRRARGDVCGRASVDAETRELVFEGAATPPRARPRALHGVLLAAALTTGCEHVAHDARAPRPATLRAASLTPIHAPKPEEPPAGAPELPPPPPLPSADDAGVPCEADGGRAHHARRHRRRPPVVVDDVGFME